MLSQRRRISKRVLVNASAQSSQGEKRSRGPIEECRHGRLDLRAFDVNSRSVRLDASPGHPVVLHYPSHVAVDIYGEDFSDNPVGVFRIPCLYPGHPLVTEHPERYGSILTTYSFIDGRGFDVLELFTIIFLSDMNHLLINR